MAKSHRTARPRPLGAKRSRAEREAKAEEILKAARKSEPAQQPKGQEDSENRPDGFRKVSASFLWDTRQKLSIMRAVVIACSSALECNTSFGDQEVLKILREIVAKALHKITTDLSTQLRYQAEVKQ